MSSQNSQSDAEQSEHEEMVIEQEQENEQKSNNEENEIKEEQQTIQPKNQMQILQSDQDQSVGTYILTGEDHTFGNALREMLAMKKEVDFVGYTIPHPSEDKINLRLQVKNQKNSNNVLKSGLKNLIKLCDVVDDKFSQALEEFQESQQTAQNKQKKSKKK